MSNENGSLGAILGKAIHNTSIEKRVNEQHFGDAQREWLKKTLMGDLRKTPMKSLTDAVHEASIRINKGEDEWRGLRDKAVRALGIRLRESSI